MGSIYRYEKIRFSPYEISEGNIEVRNFYVDDKGKKKSVQSHLKLPSFSFFEILYREHNHYYGKMEEYMAEGYEISFGGGFLQRGGHSIDIGFFHKPYSYYMLAHWEKLNHDECIPDLVFTGSRPFNLTIEEQATFMKLASVTQLHIEKKLREFTNKNQI
jgi:hypothetical protein